MELIPYLEAMANASSEKWEKILLNNCSSNFYDYLHRKDEKVV